TASPVAAQIVRWRTVVAIVQPGNVVGSFTTPPSCPINGAGCFNGGGIPWSGGGLPPQEEQQQLSNTRHKSRLIWPQVNYSFRCTGWYKPGATRSEPRALLLQ